MSLIAILFFFLNWCKLSRICIDLYWFMMHRYIPNYLWMLSSEKKIRFHRNWYCHPNWELAKEKCNWRTSNCSLRLVWVFFFFFLVVLAFVLVSLFLGYFCFFFVVSLLQIFGKFFSPLTTSRSLPFRHSMAKFQCFSLTLFSMFLKPQSCIFRNKVRHWRFAPYPCYSEHTLAFCVLVCVCVMLRTLKCVWCVHDRHLLQRS